MVPTSLVFNADQRTISERTVPTTIALTATGQPLITTNWSVQSKSVDYAEKRDILLPTALLMMTGMIMMLSRMRDMLEIESVTQGNEGGSVMVFFLSFLLLMDFPFLLLHMDIMSHGHPCDSFQLVLSLTYYDLDAIPLLGSSLLELCLMSPLTHL